METLNDVLNALKTKKLYIANSTKNLKTISKLGITFKDQKDLIKSLTAAHYVSGPEDDHDGTEGNIWIFKKSEFGETFYIKIKYIDPIIVISCHIDNIEI